MNKILSILCDFKNDDVGISETKNLILKNISLQQIEEISELLKFVDWILESKIPLCDKRCERKEINTSMGTVKTNECKSESCPDLILKLLVDNLRFDVNYFI